MVETQLLAALLLLFLTTASTSHAFSAGKGFGSSPANSNAYVSFDRFKSSCPSDINAIRQFEPSLLKENDADTKEDDVWVAVYRSANNLPSVFVRDSFMDAMKASTTVQEGDAETLVSSSKALSSGVSSGVISNSNNGGNKPVAVARLGKVANSNSYIIDSMRCVLEKENTDDDCDGGSEHAEAIGVCIDELVLSFLQRYNDETDEGTMRFDGGIHFRGTLVSGKLLDSRGFREATELTADMSSHESDFNGALAKYAERSTSKEVAKNPGARDRALKIVSYLGQVDWDEDQRRSREEERSDSDDEEDSDFDPWAGIKSFY